MLCHKYLSGIHETRRLGLAPIGKLRLSFFGVMAILLFSHSASSQLHAAILPTEVDLPKNRWVTFYATLLNDSDSFARSCSIAPDQPEVFELAYVVTDPTNNQPRSFKNPQLDIEPGAYLTYRIRLRTRSSAPVPGLQILFNFSCENVDGSAKHSELNRVNINSIVDTKSAQEVLEDIGCVEQNLTISSSMDQCFQELRPDSLVIRQGRRATEYYLCFEDADSRVDRMYLVIDSFHGRSAHECSILDRSVDCSISNGRVALRSGGDFMGTSKGGFACFYPASASKESEETMRLIDNLSKEAGDYRYGEPFCDAERCFWEKLDDSGLDELIPGRN